MNVSDAFLQDAGGARNLDRAVGTHKGNSQMRFGVAGTAPGAHTYDQASLFFAETDSAISSSYALATVTPSVSRFNNAQVGDFIALNPMHIRNLNVVGADSADTIASMEIRPVRYTPFGEDQSETIYANAFQTAGDFQTTRVQVPIAFTVDGYSSLRIINDANATPAAYNLTVTFGARADRRLEVPAAGAAVIKSSAG